MPGRREAVHPGHAHVHEHHVGAAARSLGDRLHTVRGVADDLDVLLGREQRGEPRAHHRLVVGDENSNGHNAHSSVSERAPVGSSARTLKPPSSVGPASSVPPTRTTRSRMPTSPSPVPSGSGEATPPCTAALTTVITTDSPPPRTSTSVDAPAAWRTTLLNASCTTR